MSNSDALEPFQGRATQAAQVVIVLGMHRSGTSALSGALAAMGFHPGDQLIPAVEEVNTYGFFEDERAIQANDAILQAIGRDWRLPLPLPAGWQNDPAIVEARAQIRALLHAQQRNKRWLLKDPRLCMLLPIWLTELAALQVEPRIVMSYRDPDPVAQSLADRDGLPNAMAQQLWLTHLLAAEIQSRGLPRYLVHYDDLVHDPARQLTDLAQWLALEEPVDALVDQAIHTIQPAARHHQPSRDKHSDLPLVQRIAKLFHKPSAGRPDFPSATAIDDTMAQLTQALVHTQPIITQQWRAASALEAQFGEAMSQLEQKARSVDLYESASIKNAETAAQAFESVTQAKQLIADKDSEIQRLTNAHSALTDEFASFQTRAAQVVGEGAIAAPFTLSEVVDSRDTNSSEPQNDYEGVINLAVENNSHTRVARYVSEASQGSALRILEVGCSSGYFGQALQKLGHEVWGIETNPGAARKAAALLHQVFCGSVEAFFIHKDFEHLTFDVILYGDVLEHLIDPIRVLRASAARLTQNGSIIASLPNIAHERARMMLFDGRWEYSATGIMDNTHLRFYTRDSMVEMFTEAGLAIKRLSPITLNGDAVGIPLDPDVAKLVANLITDKEKDVFQYVIQGVAHGVQQPSVLDDENETINDVNYGLNHGLNHIENNNLFKRQCSHRILCLPPLADSSLYSIRLGDPIQRLTELFGGEVRLGDLHNCPAEEIDWADTIVFQREANEPTLELIRRLRRVGKRIVFDIDDLLLDVPEYLGVHEHCKAMRPALESLLREVDAVSVSTQPLADELRTYNPNVFTTPNYSWSSYPPISHAMLSETELAQYSDTNANNVRVIIASSDSVRVDFLVDALLELSIDASLDIELVAIGPPGLYLREAGVELAHIDNMPHSQFKAFLASRPNTIALIPLDDNLFNRCKSAIKYFDYALAGVPCICSDVIPYQPVIESGSTGLLCANARDAWVEAIRALVADADQRNHIAGQSLVNVLRHHNLNRTGEAWQRMLNDVPFPTPDPTAIVEAISDPYARTPIQLARGTVRHLLQPQSYSSAWRIFRKDGIQGLRDKWKLVF